MPIKVLFISHDASLAGAERCLLDLVSQLDKSKISPFVLLPWDGPLANELDAAGIPYLVRHTFKHWIPYRKSATALYPLKYLRGLRARLWSLIHLVKNENIDLIYTNTVTVLEGAIVARRSRIPHIWHIHEPIRNNPDIRSSLPTPLVTRICLTLSSRVVVPSYSLATDFFSGFREKVDIVHNGVDPNKLLNGSPQDVHKQLGIDAAAPIVTLIGISSRRKDPFTFINAAAIIAQSRPDTCFLIAGKTTDKAYEQEIIELIKALGLTSNIYLLGFFDSLENLLAATTVHVSTSVQESFGLTLTEAMSAGKPVVATRCGGPEEVVADGVSGYLCAQGDFQSIANNVIKLINKPSLAHSMGEKGRQRVLEDFTTSIYVGNIEKIITKAYANATPHV